MKLSIITVNRNNAEGLKKTIESVIQQTYKDVEYIVIDGASTDYSVDVITEYAKNLHYWVSEPDTGIYNAMNKATLKANGDYCLYLNSGDWLVDNKTLENAVLCLTGDADIYYGRRINYYSDNDISRETSKHQDITPLAFLDRTPSHQCSFIRRSLLLQAGLYHEKFRINSDWLFFLDALVNKNATFKYIDQYISFYDMRGLSSQSDTERLRRQERIDGARIIFGQNSSIAIEVLKYHNSLYYEIVNRWGETKLLHFILRCYKVLARRIKSLQKKDSFDGH